MSTMKLRILLVHNYYLRGGGEDTVFEADSELLRLQQHEVFRYVRTNSQIAEMGAVSVAAGTVWSPQSHQDMKRLIGQYKPDLVQFYNTFPLISPAAYYACHECGVPAIQYLFNPRFMCLSASLYRDGKLCTDCIGKTPPWPGVVHGCYHESRIHSTVVASMLTFHRWIGTWKREVDGYLSATNFYRGLYIEAGLPAEKVHVKPNYIPSDPGIDDKGKPGEYALFVGRLDAEKGILTLLQAWKSLNIPLRIRGNGRLEERARAMAADLQLQDVEFVDRLDKPEMAELRRNARFLVWPSEGYYETFGLAAVECFAQGVPVIASNIGVMTEIVQDGKTGLLFKPGDAQDLAAKVQWLWDHPEESARMGRNARKEYEQKYTAEHGYQRLMEIYDQVLENWK